MSEWGAVQPRTIVGITNGEGGQGEMDEGDLSQFHPLGRRGEKRLVILIMNKHFS